MVTYRIPELWEHFICELSVCLSVCLSVSVREKILQIQIPLNFGIAFVEWPSIEDG